MQSPSDRRDGTKSPASQICVQYKSTARNVRIFVQRDANVSPIKTFNAVSRWNGVKGQENDKRLHTTPEDWKYKSKYNINPHKVNVTETLTPKTGNREPQQNYRIGTVSNE